MRRITKNSSWRSRLVLFKRSEKAKSIYEYFGNKKGYVYLILMLFTSGITTVITKYLMLGRLNAFHILTYTSFIGIIVMVTVNSRKGKKNLIKSKIGLGWLLASALTGFAFYELLFNVALQYMTVSQTIIIYYSHPVFLYFSGLIFLNEGNRKIDSKVLLGIAVSFSGIYFVLTGGHLFTFNINAGLIYIFLAIISITIFTILGKKKEIPETQFLFVGQTLALIFGAAILTVNKGWIVPTGSEFIYLIFIAVVYNLINMLFYVKTIQFLSVDKLSTLTYLSPVITSLFAVIILKEPVTAAIAIGLSMVIVGNIISGAK